MNIEDIIDQEKQKKLIESVKRKQDKHLKKLFYKDCYKMWKDYKKVESPYFWWLGYFHIDMTIFGYQYFYFWLYMYAPKTYLDVEWFNNKWERAFDGRAKIKHKSNPNDEWVYLD